MDSLKAMHIVFDCRYTRLGVHDGISRFGASLVAEVAKLHRVTMLISDRAQLAMLPDLPWALVSSPTSLREPLVALQVNKLAPDVVFSPMQTMGSRFRRYPLVLTVHDLIYYEHRTPPRNLPSLVRILWRLYHLAWWPQRMLLNGADEVVAVSGTTAELIAMHHLTKRRVTVVPNAPAREVEDSGTPAELMASLTGHRVHHLVYMGSFMPYKGVETLVLAAELDQRIILHLCSRVSEDDRARLLALAPAADIRFHNGVSDDEYAELLDNATALVSASRAEGFGIPLVEAMQRGIPALVSDIPIFHEVAGDAAVYFDPTSPQALVASLELLSDDEIWRQKSSAAIAQAKKYSWKSSGERLVEVLERVAPVRH